MGIKTWWRRTTTPVGERRDIYPLDLNAWAQQFMSFQGNLYPFVNQTLKGNTERIGDNFAGLAQGAFRGNGVVFACEAVRILLFSEARFQFRQIRNGRPGDLFGTPALDILETPWPNGTTGDLMARAECDAGLGGNAYFTRRGQYLKRMRPDWVTIVLGSAADPDVVASDLDAEVLGYIYHPGGVHSGQDPVALDVDAVAHWAPIPDPTAFYRGMSWMTPVISEITSDTAATEHKMKFFENGATPNMVVTMGDQPMSQEKFEKWVKTFSETHEGVENAYKTLYLAQGADAKVVGRDFQQMDFKTTQGAGETRIAAAAGVPPVIVGLSEGLQSATYSNYTQARRRFADGTLRPLWRQFAASMAPLIHVPPNSELWYDDRDIPFLREDVKDFAEHQQRQAIALNTLVMAGYDPMSAVDAIVAGDFDRLVHTGMTSVQMKTTDQNTEPTPMTDPAALVDPAVEPAASNGKPNT